MPETRRRESIRAACRIVAATRTAAVEPPPLPLAAWERVAALAQLLEVAQARRWRHAHERCRERLRRAASDLRRQLDECDRELARRTPDEASTLRDVVADLDALEREFVDVRIDLKESLLAVVTESIVLQGVELGPFEIELAWERKAVRSFSYAVRALSPRPATGDESVVHPHVRDDQLCEGEGHAAICAALHDRRLLDFFTIVAQTLATYNGESAFASLEHWAARRCTDCGATVDDDEGSCCERCESSLCGDCDCGCSGCGRTACSTCGASCAACHEHCCQSCLEKCSHCHEDCCERCCHDGECSICRTAAADEQEVNSGEAAADPPPTPVSGDSANAVRLGEAALLA
ncbi:MAG: hypothetical protein JNL18_16285 [Planctomycetaceae bacterium]|nr:hypothetical protein [Planctomycetaceae bacterium]